MCCSLVSCGQPESIFISIKIQVPLQKIGPDKTSLAHQCLYYAIICLWIIL